MPPTLTAKLLWTTDFPSDKEFSREIRFLASSSADGGAISTIHDNNKALVWDAASAAAPREIDLVFKHRITSWEMSPAAKDCFASSSEVVPWVVIRGPGNRFLNLSASSFNGARTITVAPKGDLVAWANKSPTLSGWEDRAFVWDIEGTRAYIKSKPVPGAIIQRVAFADNAAGELCLYAVDSLGSFYVWDTEDVTDDGEDKINKCSETPAFEDDGPGWEIEDFAVKPDGSIMVAAWLHKPTKEVWVHIWHPEKDDFFDQRSIKPALGARISPCTRYLGIKREGGKIEVTPIGSDDVLCEIVCEVDEVATMEFFNCPNSEDAKFITVTANGKMALWQLS